MATTQAGIVLWQVRRLMAPQGAGRAPDRQLLVRFLDRRDESAFEELVRRHGPLVWGVCRRVLGDRHAAEDAFQATFLTRARKAGSISSQESVSGWLHQVAFGTNDPAVRQQTAFSFTAPTTNKELPLWPEPVVTDEQGRFRVRGFGRGHEVRLRIEDDRFALQELDLPCDGKEANVSLAPPQRIEGRVVFEDTGDPAADVWLTVASFRSPETAGKAAVGQADARDRFRINLFPAEAFSVDVFAPKGSPYLGVVRRGEWNKGAVKHELEIKLPRGVLLRGKVVEAGSGKPVDQASLYFRPQAENNPHRRDDLLVPSYYPVVSEPDGSFVLAAPPGPGRLIVKGPGRDFVYQTVSQQELLTGKPGGPTRYFHAATALDLTPEEKSRDLTVSLRRGVTLKGTVVGPDGKPVPHAVLFGPGELFPANTDVRFGGLAMENQVFPVVVRDGTFELHGCDPDRTYRLFFLDVPAGKLGVSLSVTYRSVDDVYGIGPGLEWVNSLMHGGADRLGATAEVSAKKADGKPVTVRLAPCGKAELRCVDARGKPARTKLWLELVVTPGPSMKKSLADGKPAAQVAALEAPTDRTGRKSLLEADDQGRVTIPALVPGAAYRLKIYQGDPYEGQVAFETDFTAEGGKTVKLPDVVVPAP